jgi:acyl-CoA dehydrogenase
MDMIRELENGVVAPSEGVGKWERAAWDVGVEVAGPNADDVDRLARFPHESLAAMRDFGLLSAPLPEEFGGGGANAAEMACAIRALAFHCASSALVLAMHTIEAFNLGRHGTTPPLRDFTREVAKDQLLLANANSEVGVGGDVARSICALNNVQLPWTLQKDALAISYGEYADAIMSTTRSSPDAAETDQIYVVVRRGSFTLEPLSEWDTLGLRGTCSRGFRIVAEVEPGLVFATPFGTMANEGLGQARQIMLSAVWVGLAEAAAAKAHDYVRAAARRTVGVVPPGALRVAEIAGELQAARSLLITSAIRFASFVEGSEMSTANFSITLRDLKVSTSKLSVNVSRAALEVCGIMGYKQESPFSLLRIIRDAHGGLVMVSNDRYLHDNAQLLLATKTL